VRPPEDAVAVLGIHRSAAQEWTAPTGIGRDSEKHDGQRRYLTVTTDWLVKSLLAS
jgi:hypothetical protein